MAKSRPKEAARRGPRRPVLGIAAAIAIAAIAAAAWWTRPAPGRPGPLIIFSIDTLRADRLPAYGYGKTRTPNIDRFVRDSVLFERAYSHSPQTLPAHTSILSGELPFEHGVRDNIGFTVREGQRFLQHALEEAGYTTAGFVSSYVLRRQTGFNQGFDTYDDDLPAASPELPLGQVQRPGADTVAAALRWIDRQTAPKFFAFVHIYEPHRPYAPPPRFQASDRYDGEVEYSDEIVGQFLDHLRRAGLYDPATIVLLADHGEGLGDHGEDEHGIFLYRATTHVPLIAKLPASRGGNRRVDTPVQHIDLVPTILDVAGLAIPGTLRGRSLRPALEDSGPLTGTGIYAESLSPRYHFGWSELYSLSDGRYRFIRAPRDELYDISQDPSELKSIAAERPQVTAAMRAEIDRLIARVEITAPSAVSDADREKLAALGYVGTGTTAPGGASGSDLPDPKDKIAVLRKYKQATDLAGERRFAEAASVLRELVRDEPQMTDVWVQLAGMQERLGRLDAAIDAYRGAIKSNPNSASALTGAAAALFKAGRLDDARAHAELAARVAPAAAHELLARIAVARGDAATARREAALAHDADPSLPAREMIEGMLLREQGQYAAAVPHFRKAREIMDARSVKIADVTYYLADSLARLERYEEAEPLFAAELSMFPHNLRARAGQAMLFRATGRDAESERAIAEMLRVSPTPEAFDLAAQLWTMFGEPRRAAAVRAAAARRQ